MKLSSISYLGAAVFAVAIVIAGALHPGYSHLREGISALSATNSPSAPIMIVGFVGLAVSVVAAGLGLFRALPAGVTGRAAAVIVTVAGALIVVVGLARQSCSDFIGECTAGEEAGTLPLHHVVHQLVSLLVFVLAIIATAVLARGLARNGLRRLAWPSALVSLVSFVTIALLVFGAPGPAAGLVQRLLVLVLFGWIIAAAPLAGRIRAAGMPVGAAAFRTPVEVP